MSTVTKECRKCHAAKPLDQFYKKSQVIEVTKPTHVLTECIECMLIRNTTANHISPYEARSGAENIALAKLHQLGIWAQPGKSISAIDVDIVAWGCVQIEVKWAALYNRKGSMVYHFATTRKQQQFGILADLVMLVCEPEPTINTFHIFPVTSPIFYTNGKVKAGWTYVPDAYRKKAATQGEARLSITDDIMNAARDRFDLIEDIRRDWQHRAGMRSLGLRLN